MEGIIGAKDGGQARGGGKEDMGISENEWRECEAGQWNKSVILQ